MSDFVPPTIPTDIGSSTDTPILPTPSSGSEPSSGKPRNTSKLVAFIVGGLGLLILGSAAGYVGVKSTAKEPVANRVVKIGLIAPLTGEVANYGEVMQHGVELAQRNFNVEGLTLQILVRDTVCDGDKAAAAVTELIKAGAVAIIGETCSGATLKALPIANKNKVVLLSPSASSPELTVANDYFYRTYPTDSHQGVFATKMMYDKGIRKIAILHGNEAYGAGLDAVAVENFKKLGGTVVSDEVFKNGDTNFKARLQAIQALKPDAIYFVTEALSTSAAIVAEARQLGMTTPIYGSDALKDSSFLSDVGGAGEGMTIVAVTTGNRSFLDEYKATYGSEPANATGAQAYDAFVALSQVIKGGAYTGEQIRAALPKVHFQGKSGEIKFDKYGDLAGGGYLVYTIQNKKFVLTDSE